MSQTRMLPSLAQVAKYLPQGDQQQIETWNNFQSDIKLRTIFNPQVDLI